MKEVFPNVFMEEIPLTGSPLRELNCYIIRGTKRNLVIDVGYDIEEGREKIKAALKSLDCRPEVTDLYITHVHEDHIGAMLTLRGEGCFANTYISRKDAEYFNQMRESGLQGRLLEMARWEGFSDEEARLAYEEHPASGSTGGQPPVSFVTVQEGDLIDLGGFVFRVYNFPGHTMGHSALYEENKRLLFAGDHILGRISPNITFWQPDFDAIGAYLASLKRARELEVDHLFSAHRQPVLDMRMRIDELLSHHQRRLEEICRILREGETSLTVCQVAEKMHWDYGGGDFSHFAMTQKWFATGEAFAHLEYLYREKMADREMRDEVFYYSK